MTYAELLRRHEAERARRVDVLVRRAQERLGAAFDEFARRARRLEESAAVAGAGWPVLFGASFDEAMAPAVSAAEEELSAAMEELVELGVDQADEEVEALDEEASAWTTPAVDAAASAVALGAGLEWYRQRARQRGQIARVAVAPVMLEAELDAVRAGILSHTVTVATTEATKATTRGAMAAILTYTGVDAYWRTEADPCPECAALTGQLVDVATGIPPAHPNCRCTTVPWTTGDRVPVTVGAA